MVELSNKRYRSVQLSFIALELRFFWFHCIGVAVSFHHYFVSVFGLSDGTRAF